MIVFLKGTLILKMPTWVEIDVMGVGYGLTIPISTFDCIPDKGSEVTLLTYQYVREDTLALYGFYSASEKEMFAMLLKVSGIGPKVAIAILSTLSDRQIHNAILNEDVKLISSVPGIGKKTAERLIVELKDKVCKKHSLIGKSVSDHKLTQYEQVFEDAVSALNTLGYNNLESRRAISEVFSKNEEASGILENCIREGLKILKRM